MADAPDGSMGVRGLLIRHLDEALASTRGSGPPSRAQVHDTRRSLKRARALLVLLRSSLSERDYEFCKKNLRDAGRALAEARDTVVVAETLDSITRRAGDEAPFNARPVSKIQLKQARKSAPAAVNDEVAARTAYDLTAAVHARLSRSSFPASGWSALEPGLSKTYRRGRQRFRQVARSRNTNSLHDWRKQVKKYLHMLEVLQPTNPERLDVEIRELRRLAKGLGKDHDIALLQAHVVGETDGKKVAPGIRREMSKRRAELQARALQIGKEVYGAAPKEIEDRNRRDWRAWRARMKSRSSRPR